MSYNASAHARTTDPWTSRRAAQMAPWVTTGKIGHKDMLLIAYYSDLMSGGDGLTDAEAADMVSERFSLRPGWGFWKRCSDLRNDEHILVLADTKQSPVTGQQVMMCRISQSGIDRIDKLLGRHVPRGS